MFQLVLGKIEEPEIKLPTSARASKTQESSKKKKKKKVYFYFADSAKAFDYVDQNKLWKILKEMGIPDHPPPCIWEICMHVRNQHLELDIEQQTGSK